MRQHSMRQRLNMSSEWKQRWRRRQANGLVAAVRTGKAKAAGPLLYEEGAKALDMYLSTHHRDWMWPRQVPCAEGLLPVRSSLPGEGPGLSEIGLAARRLEKDHLRNATELLRFAQPGMRAWLGRMLMRHRAQWGSVD